MPAIRMDVVKDAYEQLQRKADGGLVSALEIRKCWSPWCHPEVQKGLLTESEALEHFLKQWDVASADGLVSFKEFLDYYLDVSAAVEKDEVFVELVRRAWGL